MKYDHRKIKQARIRKLMTQAEVAKKAKLSTGAVNLIELGKAPMWVKAFRQLLPVLDLSFYDIEIPTNGKRKAS